MLVVLVLFGLVQMMLDPFLWGIASYAIFRLCMKSDGRWQIGAGISALLFFLWNEVVCSILMSALGLSISDESIAEFMGPDMWNIDLFDIVSSIGLAFGGFVLGRIIVNKVARGLQGERSDQQEPVDAAPEGCPFPAVLNGGNK